MASHVVCNACPNGLIDVAVPIMIEGEHVANLFAGQFLAQSPDIEFFRRQAHTAQDGLAAVGLEPAQWHGHVHDDVAARGFAGCTTATGGQ